MNILVQKLVVFCIVFKIKYSFIKTNDLFMHTLFNKGNYSDKNKKGFPLKLQNYLNLFLKLFYARKRLTFITTIIHNDFLLLLLVLQYVFYVIFYLILWYCNNVGLGLMSYFIYLWMRTLRYQENISLFSFAN